jgi:monoamine oxidase
LPADRAKLQSRWLANPGAKYFAIYDSPFWLEDGLAGFASGLDFVALAADFSPPEGGEGHMGGMIFVQGPRAGEFAAVLADPERAREAVLDDLVTYFGPPARDAKEVHVFDWHGDRWSRGAGGAQLAPGVLTSYGHALRAPIGPILWAGDSNGTGDYMEGAASSGRAAAGAAAALVAG